MEEQVVCSIDHIGAYSKCHRQYRYVKIDSRAINDDVRDLCAAESTTGSTTGIVCSTDPLLSFIPSLLRVVELDLITSLSDVI